MVKASKNKAFSLGAFFFLCTLGVDIGMLIAGLTFMGIISLIGTLLVFSSGLVWLIYQNDKRLHVHSPWLAVPLAVCAAGVGHALSLSNVSVLNTPENLPEIGNLLMARYQLGLWIVSILIFFSFIIGASLMVPKKDPVTER